MKATTTILALTLPALVLTAPGSAQGVPTFQGASAPLYFPLNDTSVTALGQGARIELNGDVLIELSRNHICMGTDPNAPTPCPGGVEVELDFKTGIAIEIDAESDGTISRRLPLVAVPIVAFYFPLVPGLSGTIVADSRFTIDGNVEAGMRMSFVAQSATGGDAYYFDTPYSVTEMPETAAFLAGAPDVSGQNSISLEAGVEGGVTVVFSFLGIPLASPYVRMRAAAVLEVDPAADPWWDVDGYVAPAAGWGSLGGRQQLMNLPTIARFDIAQAAGPFAVGTPPDRWSRSYDHSQFESIVDAAMLDEDIVVVSDGAGASSRAWLARLAPDGTPVWELFGQQSVPAFLRPFGILIDSGGTVLIGGSSSSTVNLRLVEFDDSGTQTGAEEWLDLDGDNITGAAMTHTADGGLAVAGKVTRTSPIRTHPFIARFDASGAFLWAREYDLDETLNASSGTPTAILETRAGSLVLAGHVTYEDGPATTQTIGGRNALVMSVAADGSLEWAKAVGGIGYDEALAMANCHGALVLAGKVGAELHGAWTAALDQNGVLLWSTCFSDDAAGGVPQSDTALATSVAFQEGGAILSGTVNASLRDSFLAKVDLEGDLVFYKSFRGPDDDQLFGVIEAPRGILAFGSTRSTSPIGTGGDEDDMWVVRTSVDGMLHFDATTAFDVENDNIGQVATDGVVCLDVPGQLVPMDLVQGALAAAYDPVISAVQLLTD